MKTFLEIMKVTAQFFAWTLMTLILKPLKWFGVTAFKVWKDSKKPKFKTEDAVTDTQSGAAKHLPELTKKLDELNKKMSKLSTEWNTLSAEKQRIESVINVASGDFVKPKGKPANKGNQNNNNQNNNKQNNNKQNNNNNGQKQVPAIGDADFA